MRANANRRIVREIADVVPGDHHAVGVTSEEDAGAAGRLGSPRIQVVPVRRDARQHLLEFAKRFSRTDRAKVEITLTYVRGAKAEVAIAGNRDTGICRAEEAEIEPQGLDDIRVVTGLNARSAWNFGINRWRDGHVEHR